jgi:hypothetical protein
VNQWPKAQLPFIGSLNKILPVLRTEMEMLGEDAAHLLHAQRAQAWIDTHQDEGIKSREETIEVLAMATALQFVALLLATGEVFNDPK